MKWKKGRNQSGTESEYFAVSDAGYTVARFNVEAGALYRPSKGGRFIGDPTPDPQVAKKVCERHHAQQRSE